jgi:hypothetical protein
MIINRPYNGASGLGELTINGSKVDLNSLEGQKFDWGKYQRVATIQDSFKSRQ